MPLWNDQKRPIKLYLIKSLGFSEYILCSFEVTAHILRKYSWTWISFTDVIQQQIAFMLLFVRYLSKLFERIKINTRRHSLTKECFRFNRFCFLRSKRFLHCWNKAYVSWTRKTVTVCSSYNSTFFNVKEHTFFRVDICLGYRW